MTLEAAAPRPGIDLRVLLGVAFALAVAVLALVSLGWTPHGAASLTPLAEPDASHWIGTDAAGRDGTSVVMAATLTTLLLAVFGSLASLFVGIPIGVALALRLPPSRHTAHAVGMLPAALLIGMVVSGLAAPANLTLFLAIALPGAVVAASVTRRVLAPLWQRDYVTAARLAGLRPLAAAQRHVLPRLLPQLAALALELLAVAILVEVSLSFAGLGVLPPGASLGLMLREAQQFMAIRPLLILVPGAIAAGTALALMLAASGLRGARHGT
ncbi:MAG TPA: ABC transporter permease subunit [Devosia sp.]|jgi:peptide/nickel transport system permease protein|uniref:ABC transporter permease subunit n=1 Tax=Devosia sp. TaxID=1871048 RepID=UPI002DDD3BF3|nr:ABC transporter permease subunit [Devosia sp.]HEV2518955.1 ABC transporter permease subunit [Devosia sp.]